MKKFLLMIVFIFILVANSHAADPISYVGKLYQENCMMCHGVYGDGKGQLAKVLKIKPRDFTSYKEMSHLLGDSEQIQDIISKGSPGTPMPAFGSSELSGDPLTSDEIVALSKYVQSFLAEEQFKIEMCVRGTAEFDTMVEGDYTISTDSKLLTVQKNDSNLLIYANNKDGLIVYMTRKPTRAIRTFFKVKQDDRIPLLMLVRFNFPCPKYLKGKPKIMRLF